MTQRFGFQAALIAACLFLMMLPVTGMVPILQEITQGRFPSITTFEKHLFMSINMIGAFLFAPIAGLLSDRLQQRKQLIRWAFLFNAGCLYTMSLPLSFEAFFAVRFLEGCAHITSLSLLMTLGVDLGKKWNAGKMMGLIGAAISFGVAFGAPLGGAIGQGDPLHVFTFGTYLILFVWFLSASLRENTQAEKKINPIRSLLKSIGSKSRLFIPYTFTFIDRLTVGFIVSTLTLYLRNELQAEPKVIGMLMALFLLPFSLLIYPVARFSERFNLLRLMILGSAMYGVILAAMSFVSLSTIAILMLLAGIVSAVMYAPSLVMVSKLAGEKNKATAMSGFNCVGSLGFFIGPMFSGSILQFLEGSLAILNPYQLVFVIVGALEVFCALYFSRYLKQANALTVENDHMSIN
jgi:MFS family permease